MNNDTQAPMKRHGSRLQHQQAVGHFLLNTRDLFYKKHLELCIGCTPSDDNLNDIAPDFEVFDAQRNIVLMGEVTTTKHVGEMKRKVETKMIPRFTKADFFVYDYQRARVFLYDFQAGCWVSSDECEILCPILNVPMLPLFEYHPVKETMIDILKKRGDIVS